MEMTASCEAERPSDARASVSGVGKRSCIFPHVLRETAAFRSWRTHGGGRADPRAGVVKERHPQELPNILLAELHG
ncbi:uncharacterized protein LOC123403848 [Hordeum vulgare subsp. vulgare]|uniref:Predicted protein n=1 Tax=Hordeum vulgare subsp. vulgare TaxID=112509 RepID=F2DTM7_HORVV|nr:uncharacterized protein LOC123403848 [Hordeum vulgare subsp. vulgare]BAJ98448.1 predicted protein [Hordeum vulgare subsp. vulgare]